MPRTSFRIFSTDAIRECSVIPVDLNETERGDLGEMELEGAASVDGQLSAPVLWIGSVTGLKTLLSWEAWVSGGGK
jgi:hypothetical protein